MRTLVRRAASTRVATHSGCGALCSRVPRVPLLSRYTLMGPKRSSRSAAVAAPEPAAKKAKAAPAKAAAKAAPVKAAPVKAPAKAAKPAAKAAPAKAKKGGKKTAYPKAFVEGLCDICKVLMSVVETTMFEDEARY